MYHSLFSQSQKKPRLKVLNSLHILSRSRIFFLRIKHKRFSQLNVSLEKQVLLSALSEPTHSKKRILPSALRFESCFRKNRNCCTRWGVNVSMGTTDVAISDLHLLFSVQVIPLAVSKCIRTHTQTHKHTSNWFRFLWIDNIIKIRCSLSW